MSNFQISSRSAPNEDKMLNSQQPVIGSLIQSLNPAQYQQLMTILSTHLASSSNTAASDYQGNKITSYNAGFHSLMAVHTSGEYQRRYGVESWKIEYQYLKKKIGAASKEFRSNHTSSVIPQSFI
ncbi:uncharacterized protein LOC111367427 [Olea europaea var. sylvestris]|uniref:uncharacterized protein LOC111367427 n=1 Tax=Olea europaea var. sylvestris TaxID=158386 RepID=UPI000C1D7711|nr:uncharacterized protein LOC111367427 [Olea europaea var. sylvestris]